MTRALITSSHLSTVNHSSSGLLRSTTNATDKCLSHTHTHLARNALTACLAVFINTHYFVFKNWTPVVFQITTNLTKLDNTEDSVTCTYRYSFTKRSEKYKTRQKLFPWQWQQPVLTWMYKTILLLSILFTKNDNFKQPLLYTLTFLKGHKTSDVQNGFSLFVQFLVRFFKNCGFSSVRIWKTCML